MPFADQTTDLAFCDVGWIESDTAHSVNSENPIVTAHSVNSFGNVRDSTPCVTQTHPNTTTASGSDLVFCDIAGRMDRCGVGSNSVPSRPCRARCI